ncbi:MAG: hypothetical protein IPM53_04940 [Anaerolineaceae bacterium]|nr:hypothetical protein [Anaerolineaceae bacterium]
MITPDSAARRAAIRATLLAAYESGELWGEANPAWPLPEGMTRGEESHLAYLTFVYSISGGRDPVPLWQAARQTAVADPELFAPKFLAYVKPTEISDRLRQPGVARKKSDVTVWQRLGQALVMRAGGSVKQLLADHAFDAQKLLAMLKGNKTTFPVLSGPQTAPRWLYGLAHEGTQPIIGAAHLPVPVSPAAGRALASLMIDADQVSAEIFPALDTLGRLGCQQRPPAQPLCPAAPTCPVAAHCQYGIS